MLKLHPRLLEDRVTLIRLLRLLPERDQAYVHEFIRTKLARQNSRLPIVLRVLGEEYVPTSPTDERAVTTLDLLVEAQVIGTLDITYRDRREPMVTYWRRVSGCFVPFVLAWAQVL